LKRLAVHVLAAREFMVRCAARMLYHPYRWRLAFSSPARRRLQVGSGVNRIPGWINADITPSAELIVFLERRLPFADRALDRIYLEHVLEHVSYEDARHFLTETRRVLAPRGVVRIAVPDLEDLVMGYAHNDWRRFDWVNWPGHSFITTRAQMINIGFRWWGHQYLYDREEMARLLREAGFTNISFVAHGVSDYPDLYGLETRPDSTLIVEAVND
jgi:predicted SAM-dependent methyltransferase